jgi:nitric oxide reductase NorD protein
MQKSSIFREISLLFLLDTSHSMDSWKDNQRLLDLGRDCLYILTQAFRDFCPNITIATFFSLTRKNCQFKILKSAEESLDEGLKKISLIETEGHTRIGPALRHAQYLLKKNSLRRKIIVILTDGKPIDYDRYEGIYGEMDIQMANLEGERNGISTFLFTFEKENGPSICRMFGRNSHEMIKNPKEIGKKFLEFIVSGK